MDDNYNQNANNTPAGQGFTPMTPPQQYTNPVPMTDDNMGIDTNVSQQPQVVDETVKPKLSYAIINDLMASDPELQKPTYTYAELQELATKYATSEDPELRDMAAELSQIPESDFAPFESERQLKSLVEFLKQKGMTEEQAADLFNVTLTKASELTHVRILESMNPKSMAAFENLQSFGPNVFQKIFLLDNIAKKLMNSSYDNEYNKALLTLVGHMGNLLDTQYRSVGNISKLTDAQVKEVSDLFEAGKFEDAIILIFDYSKQNG